MRVLAIAAVAVLAGCDDGGTKAKAPEPVNAIQAGQWQSSYEVTNFRRADEGRPRLNMPVGTRGAGEACVGAADVSRPPPQLFVGPDFTNCRWGDNYYMRGGRLISGMICRRRGVGDVEVTVNVDFTATDYHGTVEMLTRLPTDGDVVLAARTEGRRTGECAAGADGGNRTKAR